MTQNQALYQVKLILDYMPDEDYNKIPEETIKYIYENMEEDKNIVINPDIPLENQDIDEKTYDLLEKIVKQIENPQINEQDNSNEVKELNKEELIKLLEKYKQALEQKNKEILKLKESNQELYTNIQKCPKIIKKLFFRKMEEKLLK